MASDAAKSDIEQARERMRLELAARDDEIDRLRDRVAHLEEEISRLRPWQRMVVDLDRSEWGRHEGDVESQTEGGVSLGNPYIAVGSVLGFTLDGKLYVVPERDRRYDPDAWVQERPTGRPVRVHSSPGLLWLEEGTLDVGVEDVAARGDE